MNFNEKMVTLADEVRELSGTNELLSIAAMTVNVKNAKESLALKDATITALEAELAGKAGSGETKTCTVIFNNTGLSDGDCFIRHLAYISVENGTESIRQLSFTNTNLSDYVLENVKCDSLIFFAVALYTQGLYTEIVGNAEVLLTQNVLYNVIVPGYTITASGAEYGAVGVLKAPAIAGERCSIYYAYEP